MAAQEILASGFTIQVDIGAGYITIDGINKFTPGYSYNNADTSVFSTGPNKRHLKTSIEKTVTVEGFHWEDPDTGTRDAGQEAVETIADLAGPDAVGGLKITSPGGNVKEWDGTFAMTDGGGANEDPAAWGFEFTRTGADVQ